MGPRTVFITLPLLIVWGDGGGTTCQLWDKSVIKTHLQQDASGQCWRGRWTCPVHMESPAHTMSPGESGPDPPWNLKGPFSLACLIRVYSLAWVGLNPLPGCLANVLAIGKATFRTWDKHTHKNTFSMYFYTLILTNPLLSRHWSFWLFSEPKPPTQAHLVSPSFLGSTRPGLSCCSIPVDWSPDAFVPSEHSHCSFHWSFNRSSWVVIRTCLPFPAS